MRFVFYLIEKAGLIFVRTEFVFPFFGYLNIHLGLTPSGIMRQALGLAGCSHAPARAYMHCSVWAARKARGRLQERPGACVTDA